MMVVEEEEIRKSRREEKVVGFSSASLFPTRRQEVETTGIDPLIWRITQGASIKGWEDKRDCGHIPYTFT